MNTLYTQVNILWYKHHQHLVSQVQTALPFCHWVERDLVQFKFHTARLNKLGGLKKHGVFLKSLLITTVN